MILILICIFLMHSNYDSSSFSFYNTILSFIICSFNFLLDYFGNLVCSSVRLIHVIFMDWRTNGIHKVTRFRIIFFCLFWASSHVLMQIRLLLIILLFSVTIFVSYFLFWTIILINYSL